MKEAMEVFCDGRFKDRLDQNPMLVGFKNGIYDLIHVHLDQVFQKILSVNVFQLNIKFIMKVMKKFKMLWTFFKKYFPIVL